MASAAPAATADPLDPPPVVQALLDTAGRCRAPTGLRDTTMAGWSKVLDRTRVITPVIGTETSILLGACP
jgi:hypothetical protein